MRGTEKQIKWAEDIKPQLVEKIKKQDPDWFYLENFNRVIEVLENIEDASWFINHRNSTTGALESILYEVGIYTNEEIIEMAEKIKGNDRIMKRLVNKENNHDITKSMIADELNLVMGITVEKVFDCLLK